VVKPVLDCCVKTLLALEVAIKVLLSENYWESVSKYAK
jgi:hypothetical protein